MAERTAQDVYRELAIKSADLAAKLYEADANDRLTMLPHLTPAQLEQLEILGKGPVWDGYLISKAARTDLHMMGLASRWNGMNFITQAGMAILDTLASRVLRDKANGK